MFLRFNRWAGLVCGTWYKIVNYRRTVRRGGKCPFCPPGIWDEEPNISQKTWIRHLKFRLIDLIFAMTVFLPVWNSHCTRVRFTIIVPCSDELAVHSCPSFVCRGGLRMWWADCSTVGFYCVTIPRQQTCKGSLCIPVTGVLWHETVERRHLGK